MSLWWFIKTLAITAFFCSLASSYDNEPLQDMCVAANDSQASVFVNGKICKDPKLATTDDFFASGLNVSGNAVPVFGIAATIVDVNSMPGLNTLGITVARFDLELQSISPLHMHPRASALITVLEGTLYAGFLASDPTNFFRSRLFSEILNPGYVFVFPQGLIHFQYNVGQKKATFLTFLNSQNPGLVMIPKSIFASEPPVPDGILAKGFQLNKTQIAELQNKFS
ncbi:putative germin-like protein subfamily 1 member 7-like [Capsicum annuum]|uniref:Germin-like protein n=1 Tax=Capsicum annuum TaxID=4072 RepID=A0A1U8F7U2_CAPAN|nr:germin-like protein subfamily 1 member 11 [Capsicum annuum]KAF3621179.1 putative germin-like protein subfamily 1 member 7-like [Capsicum annuum]KAF3653479.1 putative germin-like protein subfamily 1 member 7-like [Capsicum annuum]PHT94807.1 hypothetical protein T459_02689 [Capsicum annuum]